MKYLLLGLVFLPSTAFADAAKGKLSLYRWNPGYRAETEASATVELSEKEYKNFLEKQLLPGSASDGLFRGCYLSHFERPPAGRSPASEKARPKTEVYRVCLAR